MNDFTKEELQIILLDMDTYINKSVLKESPSHGQLRLKIQSMIDNYCEFKVPTMANYCCDKCLEEWHKCECDNIIHGD